jgi:hypothetical protein
MFDKLKTWQVILAILIMLGTIGGTGWKFYECKASKQSVENLAGDYKNYKMESYRQHLLQRIWALEARYPKHYAQLREYRQLQEELRKVDLKIQAYYNRRN